MIPSGYRNSQLQLQPEFPRSRKPGITTHSMGKRWTQTLLSNEKEGGRDKCSFFSPLKHGTATEQQQLQQDGALTHFPPIPILEPILVPSSPFPRPPFVFRVSLVSSVNFTNLTKSNCPIPKHFFLPMRTLQHHTYVHKKLIQLRNNLFFWHYFWDIDFLITTNIRQCTAKAAQHKCLQTAAFSFFFFFF